MWLKNPKTRILEPFLLSFPSWIRGFDSLRPLQKSSQELFFFYRAKGIESPWRKGASGAFLGRGDSARKKTKQARRSSTGPKRQRGSFARSKRTAKGCSFFVWKKQLENQNHSCFNTLTVRCRYPDITNEKGNRLCYNRKQQNRLAWNFVQCWGYTFDAGQTEADITAEMRGANQRQWRRNNKSTVNFAHYVAGIIKLWRRKTIY